MVFYHLISPLLHYTFTDKKLKNKINLYQTSKYKLNFKMETKQYNTNNHVRQMFTAKIQNIVHTYEQEMDMLSYDPYYEVVHDIEKKYNNINLIYPIESVNFFRKRAKAMLNIITNSNNLSLTLETIFNDEMKIYRYVQEDILNTRAYIARAATRNFEHDFNDRYNMSGEEIDIDVINDRQLLLENISSTIESVMEVIKTCLARLTLDNICNKINPITGKYYPNIGKDMDAMIVSYMN